MSQYHTVAEFKEPRGSTIEVVIEGGDKLAIYAGIAAEGYGGTVDPAAFLRAVANVCRQLGVDVETAVHAGPGARRRRPPVSERDLVALGFVA